MPIQEDIMDHETIGPLMLRAQMEIVLGQIEERFGLVSPNIRKQLGELTPSGLKVASRRLVKAEQIEDLFVP